MVVFVIIDQLLVTDELNTAGCLHIGIFAVGDINNTGIVKLHHIMKFPCAMHDIYM